MVTNLYGVSKGCLKNRLDSQRQVQSERTNVFERDCALNDIWNKPESRRQVELLLNCLWLHTGCLLGCWWIIIDRDLIQIGEFITGVSIKTDALVLSVSSLILPESISFSNWNGPFSAAKLSLACFESPKALVCYIVSLFWELDERKRRKWKVWIWLFFSLSLICVEERGWPRKLDSRECSYRRGSLASVWVWIIIHPLTVW